MPLDVDWQIRGHMVKFLNAGWLTIITVRRYLAIAPLSCSLSLSLPTGSQVGHMPDHCSNQSTPGDSDEPIKTRGSPEPSVRNNSLSRILSHEIVNRVIEIN